MAAKLTRYLGVQPFKTSDKHIFFGRDEDIDNLLDLIMLEKLIVLFGKSGYGKSSLLSAGIVPKLTDPEQPDTFRYRPIEVRLGTYIENQSLTPFETTKRFIADLPMSKGAEFLTHWQTEDSLWRLLKQRQDLENGQFVLIFDQFEELFSYPLEQQVVFKKQLAELLYTHIPQQIRARLDELSPSERSFMIKPLTIKAVFAIRSDRMSLLDSLKDALPAILHKRYELRPLSTQQAKDAITKPASIANADFLTPPFEYTEGGLNAIVKALTTTEAKDTTATGIEAFQLQIVCEYIENLVRDGKVPDIDGNGLPDITEAQLPEMASLYENYYRRKLAELTPSVQKAAQRVLEDGLLAEDAATGEGRRMSVDSRALLGQFSTLGLTEKLLVDLEKTYLIRREVNTVGGFSFEISHDTLVAPIQKAKAERKAIEEKERAEQAQIEREQQLVEAKKQADIERKRRQRATVLLVIAGIALVLALGAMFWAFKKQDEAENALKIVRRTEFEKDLTLAYGQLNGGNSCLSDEILERLQKALVAFKSDKSLKVKVEDLNKEIHKNDATCPLITLD
jgi:hypothetical protein